MSEEMTTWSKYNLPYRYLTDAFLCTFLEYGNEWNTDGKVEDNTKKHRLYEKVF